LQVPLIVCWDNLNTHVSAVMRNFTGAYPDWLTVVQLPPYAPGLNPVEGVRAHMNNGPGNLAACNAGQLAAIMKNRLKRIQHRPGLTGGFLAQALTRGSRSAEDDPPRQIEAHRAVRR
jgi:putative transposase